MEKKNEIKEGDLILQTYIYGNDRYFVSTLYRNANILIAPDSCYFETLVWRMSKDKKTMEKLIDENSGALDIQKAEEQHFQMCKKYLN